MEKNELYLALAKVKLLLDEYEEDNDAKIDEIVKGLKVVLKEVDIPSKYLIAEGFDNIYKGMKKS